ncbi:MAG: DNRLRE domain-containing protein [Planctomycetes bacterium]|nr:DNRLRE domain-containing protein [Planctomycetota bacterium]
MAFQTVVVASEYIYRFQPGVNHGQGLYFEANDVTLTKPGSDIPSDDFLRIETHYPSGEELYNSLIRFKGIEDVVGDLRVIDAYLTMTFYQEPYPQPWVNAIVDTYAMQKPFSIFNADWYNYDTAAPWELPGAQDLSDRGDTYFSTDMGPRNQVTFYHDGDNFDFQLPLDLVRSWINDPESNHGVLMAMDPIQQVSVDFYSSNYAADLSYRPLLTIIAVEGCDKIPADIDDDCYVNERDLFLLSEQWLSCDGGTADIVDTGDGCVNLLDYALFASQWLMCSEPGVAACTWPN